LGRCPLSKQQKSHHVHTFVHGSTDSFKPRILVATAGAANTGLDDRDVTGVFLLALTGSIVDIAQEKGRAGWYDGANPDDCFYCILICLESFLHLFKRCQDLDGSGTQRYRDAQLEDLMEVLTLLVPCPSTALSTDRT
jgi:hypothetical protein